MNNTSTVSQPDNQTQGVNRPIAEKYRPFYPPVDLSRITWVELVHPSGRVHRLNGAEWEMIRRLKQAGWSEPK